MGGPLDCGAANHNKPNNTRVVEKEVNQGPGLSFYHGAAQVVYSVGACSGKKYPLNSSTRRLRNTNTNLSELCNPSELKTFSILFKTAYFSSIKRQLPINEKC